MYPLTYLTLHYNIVSLSISLVLSLGKLDFNFKLFSPKAVGVALADLYSIGYFSLIQGAKWGEIDSWRVDLKGSVAYGVGSANSPKAI
jgi:hypothetical protein